MLGRSTSNVVMSWAPQRVGPVDVVSGGGTCAWPIPFLFYLPYYQGNTLTRQGQSREDQPCEEHPHHEEDNIELENFFDSDSD
ncbi:hypothetical protein J6590_066514 [Homalodisca vitripennis]|nr:hypothetical protein J6590_066514 [Homalodisca vitripennis]